MTVFLLLAALLLAVALLFVLLPLFGRGTRHKADGEKRQQAEVAIGLLRDQLAELKAEHAVGRVDDAEFSRTRTELEERVLAEGRVAEGSMDTRPAKFWALGLIVMAPLVAVLTYVSIGEPDALDPATHVAQAPGGQQFTPEQVSEMVVGLVDRLEDDPTDERGWAMLARAYNVLGQFDMAQQTWARIGANIPANAMLMADWADLLVAAQEGDFNGEPMRLIERALELEPDNFKALALAGAAAFEAGEYAAASQHWENILDQVPAEDPAYAAVIESINEARQRGGMALLEGSESPAEPADSEALRIVGRVAIGDGLVEGLPEQATVFVFARSVEGGMPFAALRIPASELPVGFDFAPAQRMNPAPLPDEVELVARLSMSGAVSAQAGDIESVPLVVSPDESDVELLLDHMLE